MVHARVREHHGTSASTRCRRGPTSGRGLTRAPPSATASSHATMSARSSGGAEHLGVVEQVEHPRAERGAVHDRRARRRPRRRSRRSTTASSPSWSTTQRGARRVDEHAGVDGLVLAVGERVGAHEVGGVDAGRRRRSAPARPDLGLAVDAVDPERAGRVAVAVVADHVPVPEPQHDAVRLEAPGARPGTRT